MYLAIGAPNVVRYMLLHINVIEDLDPIQSPSLSYSGLAPSSGGSLSLAPQNNVAARGYLGSSVSSGSLYYSFLVQIPNIGTTLGTGGGFFAGFNNTGAASQSTSPSIVGGRTIIRSVSGGYNLGLSKASGSGSDFAWDSQLFTTSDTVLVVAAYDFGTLAGNNDDSTRMWINPDASTLGLGTAPTPTLTASTGADVITSGGLQSFLFYARANTLFPNQMTVDELRVGTSWADVTPTTVPEPGSLALAGLGFMGLISVVRLRKK